MTHGTYQLIYNSFIKIQCSCILCWGKERVGGDNYISRPRFLASEVITYLLNDPQSEKK